MNSVNDLMMQDVNEDDTQWEKSRCPKCNALLFEVDSTFFILETVRIKCRLCKNIFVI
jgi:uncharacterized protein with PIN domain